MCCECGHSCRDEPDTETLERVSVRFTSTVEYLVRDARAAGVDSVTLSPELSRTALLQPQVGPASDQSVVSASLMFPVWYNAIKYDQDPVMGYASIPVPAAVLMTTESMSLGTIVAIFYDPDEPPPPPL